MQDPSRPSDATPPSSDRPKPRLQVAERDQVTFRAASLNRLVAEDHPVRSVWAYAQRADLSVLYAAIRAVEGAPGHPAIDPRILLALWLYATAEGVGSARELDRLCREHQAYQWICGDVTVNYHTLADFRVQTTQLLDRLLTEGVGMLASQGLVTLHRVSQDGKRIRASAGSGSFRRRKTLEVYLKEARLQVDRLRKEVESDPAASSRRKQAARERAAREREERLSAAFNELEKAEAKKTKEEKKAKVRTSMTDPDARMMKMGDGGYRPAYNVQFATDTAHGIVVGVDVSQNACDTVNLLPMVDQLQKRYGVAPGELLADGGYSAKENIETLSAPPYYTKTYIPVPKRAKSILDPYRPRLGDSESVAKWRVRMGLDESKEIYKLRAQSAEWVNAQVARQGLHQVRVRGLQRVKAIALWHAVTHNMRRTASLLGRLATKG